MGNEIEKVAPGGPIEKLYGDFDPAALKDEKQFVGDAEAGDWLKKPEGDTTFRFLPPPPGEGLPWLVVYEHSIKPPGASFPVRFPCPKLMSRKPCSYCAESARLMKTGKKADRDLGFSFAAKRQCYSDVIDRANEDHGPFIFSFGKKTHEPLQGIYDNPRKGGNIAHPFTGRDVILNRTGLGQFDTTYSISVALEPSPLALDEETLRRWLGMRHDFSNFALPMSDEENKRKVEEAADRAANSGGYTRGGGAARGSQGGGQGRSRTAADDFAVGPADDDGPTPF